MSAFSDGSNYYWANNSNVMYLTKDEAIALCPSDDKIYQGLWYSGFESAQLEDDIDDDMECEDYYEDEIDDNFDTWYDDAVDYYDIYDSDD